MWQVPRANVQGQYSKAISRSNYCSESINCNKTTSYVYLQLLWRQFLKFQQTELPVKEADKNHSKGIYQSFEVRGLCSVAQFFLTLSVTGLNTLKEVLCVPTECGACRPGEGPSWLPSHRCGERMGTPSCGYPGERTTAQDRV